MFKNRPDIACRLYADNVQSFMKLLFFETPLFSRLLPTYLKDKEYRELQLVLLENPQMGDVMPGTGGFRKMRWQDPRRGKGKRGGLRVIYYFLIADHQTWFFTLCMIKTRQLT